jgi:hypothetical protein
MFLGDGDLPLQLTDRGEDEVRKLHAELARSS